VPLTRISFDSDFELLACMPSLTVELCQWFGRLLFRTLIRPQAWAGPGP
jgi:hypothetical protein